MRKLFLLSIFITACTPTREITRERIVEYDTVYIEVVRQPVERTADIMLEDTVILDLPEVKLELIRLKRPPNSVEPVETDSIRVNITVKEDTAIVPVVHKTITEKSKEVKEKQVMAWWGWMIIGALVILLIAALLR
jgi:hypothetical protein